LNLHFPVLLAQGDAANRGASLLLVAISIPAFLHRHSRLQTLERRRAAEDDDDEDDNEVVMTCCDAEDSVVASSAAVVA
jgi:hypothetical protein